MVGFLKFVLIFFLVLFLLGLVSRLLLRLFLQRLAKKMESHQNNYEQKAGDTFIKNPSDKGKKISQDTGEYIDYEEIKD